VSARRSKEDKTLAVSKAVLEVIERDGLLGITHSKVARKAGVSRAWIYEYIGKDHNVLTEFAADVLAGYFARVKFALPKSKEQLQTQATEGLNFLFDAAVEDPVPIKLYFRFRGSKTPLGDVIKKHEKQWLTTAATTLEKLLEIPAEHAALIAELTLTLRLGFAHRLATSANPRETRASAEKIFSVLQGLIT